MYLQILFLIVPYTTFNLEFFQVLFEAVISLKTSLESGKGIYCFEKNSSVFTNTVNESLNAQGQKIQRQR